MAQRRMFSPDIVESEEFLDMPHSSQSLYFHLAMRADDDGFVQPKIVMRLIGANADDLKVLIGKRFLLSYESGVVVVKHWLVHNMIRADRYKETRFLNEKKALIIKDNKVYTDNPNKGKAALATKCQPGDNQRLPQVRLGKVRKGKDSIGKVSKDNQPEGFDSFWKEYPKKVGKGAAEKSWSKLNPPLNEVLKAIETQKESDQWSKDNGKFIPNPATWLNQRRWEDEVTTTNKTNKYLKYDS